MNKVFLSLALIAAMLPLPVNGLAHSHSAKECCSYVLSQSSTHLCIGESTPTTPCRVCGLTAWLYLGKADNGWDLYVCLGCGYVIAIPCIDN